jgi:hypothetical protein
MNNKGKIKEKKNPQHSISKTNASMSNIGSLRFTPAKPHFSRVLF